MQFRLLISICCILGIQACEREKDETTSITVKLPAHFPVPSYDLIRNPVTEAGFALGKKLFYDPALSRDSTISCADCHISFSAFSHPDHPKSHGIDGLFGRRNAPPLQNLIWRNSFFWDGGVPNLDLAPLNAIQNPVEMDLAPAVVIERLNASLPYRKDFKEAFPGSDTISSALMLQAFSQFLAMLVSAESPYDKYYLKQGTLTATETSGLALFQQKCATCHAGQFFTDQTFRNNGILKDFSFDQGRQEVSTLPEDRGKFVVPSLRNIALTPPYMHDGSFPSLESVLQHYATGVKDSPTLDPLLKQNGQLGIPMTQIEQDQIIAFLKTLSDDQFVREKLFQQ